MPGRSIGAAVGLQQRRRRWLHVRPDYRDIAGIETAYPIGLVTALGASAQGSRVLPDPARPRHDNWDGRGEVVGKALAKRQMVRPYQHVPARCSSSVKVAADRAAPADQPPCLRCPVSRGFAGAVHGRRPGWLSPHRSAPSPAETRVRASLSKLNFTTLQSSSRTSPLGR